MSAREQWSSRQGFILATIGAAVGLGNIWRFSYVAGENGGAVFLIIYLACVALVGLPLVIAELAIGRRGQGDAVAAFEGPDIVGPWRFLGWLGVFGAIAILSFYTVIAGWALKYFVGAATGSLWLQAETGFGVFFQGFISDRGQPIAWQAAMLFATLFIVAGGVQKGIERLNRWLMPLLVVIIVGLAAYSLSLPNAERGLQFLFAPDWTALMDPSVYIAALGQAFFSLGLGMAVFVTYGSYVPRTFSLATSATAISLGDSLFAIIAGLAIFPAVFAFGVDPAAGPELAFITLPQVFLTMPAGKIIGTAFFLLLSAAAFTSIVALLEVPVSMLVHRTNLSRWSASGVVGLGIFAIGLPSAMSYGILSHIQVAGHGVLDAIDSSVSNYLLPIGGALTALFVGWIMKTDDALAEADLTTSRFSLPWLWLLRVIVPLTILVIILNSASTL